LFLRFTLFSRTVFLLSYDAAVDTFRKKIEAIGVRLSTATFQHTREGVHAVTGRDPELYAVLLSIEPLKVRNVIFLSDGF
jgi:hypothetical protein